MLELQFTKKHALIRILSFPAYNLSKHNFYRYLLMRLYFDNNIKTVRKRGMCLTRLFTEAYNGNPNRKYVSSIRSSLQFERGLSATYVKSR